MSVSEADITAAVSEALREIDQHRMASSEVPPEATIAYYQELAEQCSERALSLRQEHASGGQG